MVGVVSRLRHQIAGLDRDAAKLRMDMLDRVPGEVRFRERGYQWVGSELRLGGGAYLEHDGKEIACITHCGNGWMVEDILPDGSPGGVKMTYVTRAEAEARAEALAGNPRQDWATWRRPMAAKRRRPHANVRTYRSDEVGRVTVPDALDEDANAAIGRAAPRDVPKLFGLVNENTGQKFRRLYDWDDAERIAHERGRGWKLYPVTFAPSLRARWNLDPRDTYADRLDGGTRANDPTVISGNKPYDVVVKKGEGARGPRVQKLTGVFFDDDAVAKVGAQRIVDRDFPGGSVISVKPSAKDPRFT